MGLCLVRVRCEVVGWGVVGGDVVEEVLELRGRRLGAVRGGVGQHGEERQFLGLHCLLNELESPVGDDVGQVVPGVVRAVVLLNPVLVQRVVVVLAVLNQTVPFIPARRDSAQYG